MSPRRGFMEEKSEDSIPVAVIYARYSSHAQRDVSIEQQVQECMEYAKINGLRMAHVYADRAVSGKTDRRPDFQRMMKDAEAHKFQVVIAWKSNRMGRNMLQAMTNEVRLNDLGIRCLYAEEDFDDTAAGRFALRSMMNVNQFYSENMAEDIKRGMRYNAENCKVNGALPLGYVKGPDGRYAIEPTEATLVREIYDKVLDGVPFVDIANDLNSRGIQTKQGGLWNKNSFHHMLKNDVYIGVYRHSGYVQEDGVPPIIEKEVFHAMQKHLEGKKNPRGRHRETTDYLLTGRLHCGYCEALMVGVSGTSKTGAKHYYYACNTRRTRGDCKKKHVTKDFIEMAVAELTQEFIMRDEVIEWIADGAMNILADSNGESEIREMESELAENRKAAKNIMAAIEQGIFTVTTKDRLLELEQNISRLDIAISLARNAREDQAITREHIIWHLQRLKNGDVKNKKFQKSLINTFVRAVYLWDDKIEIDYYYTGEKHSIVCALGEAGPQESDGPKSVLISSLEGHHF